MKKTFKSWLKRLASIEFILVNFGLMMALVFLGTLAQTKMGTFAAQRTYFSSFWIYGPELLGVRIPIFPGGLTVGLLWLVNLTTAFAVRFRYKKKQPGILIVHAGLILLIGGQGLTQLFAKESRMEIAEGQTKNYIERDGKVELAFIMTSNPQVDRVISVPVSLLKDKGLVESPKMPFKIRVKRFFPNAALRMAAPGETAAAEKGVGSQIAVTPLPVTTADDEVNNVSAVLEIVVAGQSKGTWLASLSLGAPQSFTVNGKTYRIEMRLEREYLPYNLTLKDFTHDIYPGTQIPKNFSSLVHLNHPEENENRDVLIYMNHPLRYRGRTFYQASFGKGDTLSVFQVMENPLWLTPYVACILVLLGLGIQFLTHLLNFLGKPR